jgi:hypothetical protein
VINVNEDIRIDMREHLGIEGNAFFLRLTSLDTVECGGMQYDYQFTRQNNNISIQINGLRNPLSCSGTDYHVSSELFLNSEIGLYNVDLSIGPEISNKGILKIENEQVSLSFSESHGLDVFRETLLRISDGTVWGYVSGQGEMDSALGYINDAFAQMGAESGLPKGYYGHFEITDAENEVIIYPYPDYPTIEAFVFKVPGDESLIREFVDNFSSQYGESVFIEIFSWTGKSYR